MLAPYRANIGYGPRTRIPTMFPDALIFLDSAEFDRDGVLVIQRARGATRPHRHQKICLGRKRLGACLVYKLRKRTVRQQTVRPLA
jgi:hypothetical protein